MLLSRRLVLLLLACQPLGSVAAEPQGPDAFVASIYALYQGNDKDPPRSAVIWDHPERYFAPELADAMKRDRERSKGMVGALDFDPFTADQLGEVHNLAIKLTGSGERQASATIEFDRADVDHSHARILIDLVRSPAGWRVFEIRWPGSPAANLTLRGIFAVGK